MRLKGKAALVTGAGQGFGYGIAEAFVREGARVACLDVKGEVAEAAAKRLSGASCATLGPAVWDDGSRRSAKLEREAHLARLAFISAAPADRQAGSWTWASRNHSDLSRSREKAVKISAVSASPASSVSSIALRTELATAA